MQATQTTQTITFRGSVATVTEFLGFAIYNILYQRAVYPSEDFRQVTRYGVPLMISTDTDLNNYLTELLQQVAEWITADKVRKLALIVTDASGSSVAERWAFDIISDNQTGKGGDKLKGQTEEIMRREIQSVMRQITASVAYLPLLNGPCAFDLLVYTTMDTELPAGQWETSEPRLIKDSSEVKLRAFSTGLHRVSASVTFREELV